MKHTDFRYLILRLLVLFLPNRARWQEESYSIPVTVPGNACIDTFLQGKIRICKYTGKMMRKPSGGEWKRIREEELLAFREGNVSLARVDGEREWEDFAELDIERNFDDED